MKLWKNPEQFLFIHDALRENIYYLELDIDGLSGWLYEHFGFFYNKSLETDKSMAKFINVTTMNCKIRHFFIIEYPFCVGIIAVLRKYKQSFSLFWHSC